MGISRKQTDKYGRLPQLLLGFTLVELIVVILVIGIVVGWAYPGFVGLVKQVRYNQSRDTLVDAISMARNEAIFNGRIVVACASSNIYGADPKCSVDQLNWNAGWMIYQECDNDTTLDQTALNCDLDSNGEADSPERIIQTFEPPDFSLTKREDSAITFFPAGMVDRATAFRVDTGESSGLVTMTRAVSIFATGPSGHYTWPAN